MSNLFTKAVADVFAPQKRSAGVIPGLPSFFPFSRSEAGNKVNTHSSLTISAFYCALNTIANSVAILPTSVYQKTGNKRTSKPDHPADYLLYREPNSYMTAYTFKFIMVAAMFMRGNAYALIIRNSAGQVESLNYMDPDLVDVYDYKGKLFYKYRNKTYSADEIIHVPGFSFDGVCGKSIIQYAADNLGVTLMAQKFGSDSLADRGVSQGVLESDLSIKGDKKKEISSAFSSAMSSGDKHRAPLLDEGMKYRTITLKPEEAKFIETYAQGTGDIARWFSIPRHKLHEEGEGGYNFLVQMSIEYLQTGVMPVSEKFKQEYERKLYTQTERKAGYYVYQNYSKLLQADPKARGQFYRDQYYIGAINPNEIRELEDRNPRDDEGGDEFVQMSSVMNEMQVKKQLQNEQE